MVTGLNHVLWYQRLGTFRGVLLGVAGIPGQDARAIVGVTRSRNTLVGADVGFGREAWPTAGVLACRLHGITSVNFMETAELAWCFLVSIYEI